MSATLIWFSLVVILVVLEMVVGSFYLLMTAIGAAVGGILAWSSASVSWQIIVAALISVIAVALLRRFSSAKDHKAAAMENFDIGHVVTVPEWQHGRARVHYRGTVWDATLAPGETERVGDFQISALDGNTLILSTIKTK